MEAIKELTFVKVYRWNNKIFLRFDLPAEKSLKDLQKKFQTFKSFKHLDMQKMYSGFIRAELFSDDCKKEEECKIYELLYDMQKKYYEKEILEGHTIKVVNLTKSFKLMEWSETLKENQEINNKFKKDDIINLQCSTIENKWKMMNVGHGLSIINEKDKIVYDAGGGGKYYDSWIRQINKLGTNIIFIISHAHLDHYNFLEKYIRKGNGSNIKHIIFNNNSSFDRKSSSSIFKLLNSKGIAISNELSLNNSTLFVSSAKNYNENDNSLLLKNNKILLTGDQRYSNIEEKFRFENIGVIQVPHHGSFGSQTGKPSSGILKKTSAYISVGNKYGLPNAKISNYFPLNKATKTLISEQFLFLKDL